MVVCVHRVCWFQNWRVGLRGGDTRANARGPSQSGSVLVVLPGLRRVVRQQHSSNDQPVLLQCASQQHDQCASHQHSSCDQCTTSI